MEKNFVKQNCNQKDTPVFIMMTILKKINLRNYHILENAVNQNFSLKSSLLSFSSLSLSCL